MESHFSGKYLWLASFIGVNLVERLYKEMTESTIIGLNNYYDFSLEEYRLKELDIYHYQLTNSLPPLNSKH